MDDNPDSGQRTTPISKRYRRGYGISEESLTL
jgi:hypothetical protein